MTSPKKLSRSNDAPSLLWRIAECKSKRDDPKADSDQAEYYVTVPRRWPPVSTR